MLHYVHQQVSNCVCLLAFYSFSSENGAMCGVRVKQNSKVGRADKQWAETHYKAL